MLRLARPKFLFGGFAAFALGSAVARYTGAALTPEVYLSGQFMVTAFQLMTHFANEYYDRHADVYTRPTAFAGGSGVLTSGLLEPRVALRAALICAACGWLGAIWFGWRGNAGTALLGAAMGILAWCYSAPPVRLAARGWGELDTAVVVALCVPLAGYAAATGTIDALALAATAAPVCAMLAMMIGVEWPDAAADRRGGKHNLVVRLGPGGAGVLGAGCALAVVPAMALSVVWGAPRAALAFALLLAPLALGFARRLRRPETPAQDIAANGVSLFFITVVFALLAFVAAVP